MSSSWLDAFIHSFGEKKNWVTFFGPCMLNNVLPPLYPVLTTLLILWNYSVWASEHLPCLPWQGKIHKLQSSFPIWPSLLLYKRKQPGAYLSGCVVQLLTLLSQEFHGTGIIPFSKTKHKKTKKQGKLGNSQRSTFRLRGTVEIPGMPGTEAICSQISFLERPWCKTAAGWQSHLLSLEDSPPFSVELFFF